MAYFKTAAAIVLVVGAASCASDESSGSYGMSSETTVSTTYDTSRPAPMESNRKIAEQDCSKPVEFFTGNLRCK